MNRGRGQNPLVYDSQYNKAQQEVAIYEVTYSTKPTSRDELSFSDIVLVEAETLDELTTKVVDLICKLGTQGNYSVDSIGGNPYKPRSKMRIAKKIIKDWDNLVSIINALILRRSQES
jgi:hypothetical protein